MFTEHVRLEGQIIDSLTLPKVLDEIVETGARYEILDLQVGVRHDDPSSARIKVIADTEDLLTRLIERLRQHGANPETVEDAELGEADVDGAFPPGFYSTTNLDTEIRVDGRWIRVERSEMDCGIVYDGRTARTIAMADVRRGMRIVMRGLGIRVLPLERAAEEQGRASFEFMSSDVSSEKPKALLVEQVAQQMRAVKENGQRILWVAGPAVVHTGSAPDLCALIRAGYVDALFAGNGVAAHDIESNIYGTSLGVYLAEGTPADHGHEHHIRAINELRRHGTFKAAIDAGVFEDGVVYHLVTRGCDYLFGGSVRDDGPLPETVTDMLEVQRRLRDIIWGAGGKDPVAYCIVVGTMLHGIATGNCLPATVPLVCVDINQATVTKLMDRGSWQSMGIITDVGLFIRELAEMLAPDEVRRPSDDADVRSAGSRTRR
ncbi:MAG TPA: TIGR00300 family protein [Actinomycetota bacterium]|jgi:lysine-ketoglutarate reductase/saccharopine dehydrogenase-like protein (TIGR00300 family)|nr:TIGR00300 family protein [Actinomycetota bacterium]